MIIDGVIQTRRRKPSLGYKLKDALDATNTNIVSLTESYIQNRFMYAIALAMAEEGSEKRSERAKLGASTRAKKGKVVGGIKYGYQVGEDGRPKVNESEAIIVKRIRALKIEFDNNIRRSYIPLNPEVLRL